MTNVKRFHLYFAAGVLFCLSNFIFASIPVKSIVLFGDSLSDTGNTSHLLKSLRQEKNPAWLVRPLKVFFINKMEEYANDYYVPQLVLDGGIAIVTHYFDHELAPLLASIISNLQTVPVVPGEPYWRDHFSNGQVWNEYLAPMLNINHEDNKQFNNQTFGGSWTMTYDHQLTVWNLIRHPINTLKSIVVGKLIPPSLGLTVQAQLLTTPHLDKDAVYFVFSGGNDYLNMLKSEDNYNPEIMSTYVDNVLDGLTSAVRKLTDAGARHLVILGVPNVGITPHFLYTPEQSVLSSAVLLHNQRLHDRLEIWHKKSPELDFLFIDVQPILQKVLDNPSDYGFRNITQACIDVKLPMLRGFTMKPSPYTGNLVLEYANMLQYHNNEFAPSEKNYHLCDQPGDYIFWDEIHPTTKAHRFLANGICQAMLAHGYEASCQDQTTI